MSRDFRRYVMWQIPGWIGTAAAAGALAAAFALPWWFAALAMALLMTRDLAFYPAMRDVFRPARVAQPVGARGVATEPLRPGGYVRIKGELWRATARSGEVPAGDEVRVTGARGLTLIVEPTRDS